MVYEILNEFGDVINTIVADESFVKKYHPNRYRAATYDPDGRIQVNPPVVSKIAMITRFTDEEYVSILASAKSDIQVEAWLDRFRAANRIELNDSRTIIGINMMVEKNLLTKERGNSILTAPVQDDEKP